jgi:hypothetical protein
MIRERGGRRAAGARGFSPVTLEGTTRVGHFKVPLNYYGDVLMFRFVAN